MKVSILTPDVSDNCLGRAYLLAKILQRHYEVEIIGPMFGEGIWKPVANDKSIVYKTIRISGRLKAYSQIRKLIKKTDGDVIYASKPLFSSFGIGLSKKILKKKPLILDIDDWEMGFRKDDYSRLSRLRRIRYLVSSAFYFFSTGSYWNSFFGEKLFRLADEVTVSNNFLKEKFGGTIVWHGRDTDAFDPEKFDRDLIREKYQIKKTKKIVLFFGTPRPHKGVEDLIRALDLIQDKEIILVIAGIDSKDFFGINLVASAGKRLGERRFLDFGLQPFEKVPEFLAMADVVTIPQRKNVSTTGQIPAKVFDAMAMAKPIIATNVSGLPEILDGCGLIVEPESPEQLAAKISYLFNNLNEAKKLGGAARQKCIENYSWDSLENTLLQIFQKYKSF